MKLAPPVVAHQGDFDRLALLIRGAEALALFFAHIAQAPSQVFEKYSDLMDLSLEKDSKTELQELLQKRQLPLPKYLNTSPKEGLFESSIVSEQNKHFLGKGSSIKEAEKDAAENYLKHLMKDE